MFDFPTSQQVFSGTSYNSLFTHNFNLQNKNLFQSKLTQKLGLETNCNGQIIPNNQNLTICFDFEYERTDNFYDKGTGFNFTYENNGPSKFKGVHNVYYDSGYNRNVKINTPTDFYKETNEMIDLQWINSASKFLSITINFYNFNIDSLIVFSQYYERVGIYYYPKTTIFTFNNKNYFNTLALITLIFSILTLLTSIYMILRSKESTVEMKVQLSKEYEKYLSFGSMSRFTDENAIVQYFDC